MPSKIDQRRLRDGAAAAALGEPETEEEIRDQIAVLHDGIAALQSLDDLGSELANDAACKQMDDLLDKYKRLEVKLKNLKKGK